MTQYKILVTSPFKKHFEETGRWTAETLEAMGHEVIKFDPLGTQSDMIPLNRKMVKAAKGCDFHLAIKGLGLHPKAIQKMEQNGCPTFIWYVDTRAPNIALWLKPLLPVAWGIGSASAAEFGLLTHHGGARRVLWLPEGILPRIHRHYPQAEIPPIITDYGENDFSADVGFAGSIGHYTDSTEVQFGGKIVTHPSGARMEMCREVAKYCDRNELTFKIWGQDKASLSTEAYFPQEVKDHHMYKGLKDKLHSMMVSSTTVSLGCAGRYLENKPYYWSARSYRVMGSGGFFLKDKTFGMDTFFKPGIHMEYYDNNHELLGKIEYYTMETGEARKIGFRGMKLVHEQHTFECRMNRLIQYMEDILR